MPVDQVDNYYYTPAQSTTDYSRPDQARRAEQAAAAQAPTPATGQVQTTSPVNEQNVRAYYFDNSTGQNVNLLV